MSPISELLRSGDDGLPGPTPSYGKPHIVLSILAIGDARLIGRQALAKEVNVGEGAVRTIIKKLKLGGYVTTLVSGCALTTKGERLYRDAKALIPQVLTIPQTELAVGSEQTALLVRGVASRVVDGLEQRDEAIKVGADGATTFVIIHSKFRIPRASQDCESDYPGRIWALLRERLRPESGDVIIICGAETSDLSKIGAVSAALTLISRG